MGQYRSQPPLPLQLKAHPTPEHSYAQAAEPTQVQTVPGVQTFFTGPVASVLGGVVSMTGTASLVGVESAGGVVGPSDELGASDDGPESP